MPIRPENRDRYPANWPAISQRIRFTRAASRCECTGECGRATHDGRCPNTHGQPAYGTGSAVVLTVAHLDHTPENCDEANLKAMCQGCHLHYDKDHHRETAAATRRAVIAASGQLTLEDVLTPPCEACGIRPAGTEGLCDPCMDEAIRVELSCDWLPDDGAEAAQ